MGLLRTVRDCVYGMAVGDAPGVPYEFMPRGSFRLIGQNVCPDRTSVSIH